jgi:hypothetical protein
MIKLSKTSKLDGISSFSFEAGKTCKGSIDPTTKQVCDACQGCYAKGGRYNFSNVKAPREINLVESKKDSWTKEMIQELDTHRYFRWFDSGDMYSVKFAEKVLEVAIATPWVKHWLPTRTWTLPKFKNVLKKLNQLPNVVVRYSSGSIVGGVVDAQNGSTVIGHEHINQLPKGVHLCDAYTDEKKGKCKGCRACWDKNVSQVAYVAHGAKGKKLAREAIK